jgi:hypothetical protein
MKSALTVTEKAMNEKDLYAWHFLNGKTYVGTPGNRYGVNPETGEVEISRLYEVGFDAYGNPFCTCYRGACGLCKHVEGWRIEWNCRVPAAQPVPVNNPAVAANLPSIYNARELEAIFG